MRLDELSERELMQDLHAAEQIKIARVYKDEGSVKELLWDFEKKHFRVYVERYNQRFMVDIEPDLQLNIVNTSCSCGRGDKKCVHVLSALLQMGEYNIVAWLMERDDSFQLAPQGLLSRRETDRMNQILHSFESLYIPDQAYEPAEGKEILQVQYVVKLYPSYYENIPGSLEIELKIGPGRFYIVKDVLEFLYALETGESLRFTKLFTYHPADHVFAEKDMAMLQRIKELMEVQMMHSAYFQNKSEAKRSFEIPAAYQVSFLEQLSELNTIIDDQVRQFETVEIQTMEKPFTFMVTREQEKLYQLHWPEAHELIYLGPASKFCFYKGKFFCTEGEKLRILHTLYYTLALEEASKLSFSEEHMESLASVLLPQLKEVGQVEMDEAIETNIDMTPLKPKLYLEHENNRVTGKVIFQYGEKEINPFASENISGEKVLVRDMKQEYRLMALIEEAPFKFNGEELFLDTFAEILYFMSSWLPVLSRSFEVYAPQSLQEIVYEPAREPQLEVNVSSEGGWMDVAFDFEGISENEVTNMMKALTRKEDYFQLDSGAFVPLQGKAFEGVRSLVEELELKERDITEDMQLPLYRAFQLEESAAVNLRKSTEFKQLLTRLLEPEEQDFAMPEGIEADLRDYQKTGYQWMTSLDYYGFGGILADDMGLGKTLQTITFLAGKLQRQQVKHPALIICPSSVIYNWKKEIERFAPGLSSIIITGSKAERDKQFEEMHHYDICITSYPVIRRDEALYNSRRFSTLILDEAQYVKNASTKTAKAVRAIESGTSYALSGTPIENSLEELYSIFRIVLPGMFPQKEKFRNMPEQEIAKRIRPFVLRRQKKEVLTELPDKLETVEYTDMTQEQKALYLGQLQLLRNEASDAIKRNSWQENRMQILAGLTRLRQICCHPGMFVQDYEGGSDKLERLMEYTDEARKNGHRIVVFSQFTKMLSIMKERFDKSGADYFYLDGSTPARDRLDMADRFNEGEKEMFLVSLKAGGTGLNLTGGDTVILFDSWWNPAVEDQAADRVYRFGQKRVVQVTKMITTGTIEEKIHELQEKKRNLLDRVVQSGETMLSSLGKEEIEELLEI
ncbi:DEAD/DEAH box helicase [Alkalicoccus daliensis]|uniref:Helicase conserved C-terminal domain-containing protein n=1 Tax=Alkalicoccus daliensis TaxID=745820 RepID=A0A1H0DYJ4_9BACI|nr:DEAD/DEAH box helicase [Alkalicoccus daliensis]SDN75103.1 Helicase conserved C-terminal domain-containing protein [Alkalicoccus daliensis]